MATHNNNNNNYTTPPSGASQAAVSNSVMMSMMRNNGGPTSTNATNMNPLLGGPSNTLLTTQLQARMGQIILDDADHRRCSEGNQRALLAEKLENLRQWTNKELENDEWMYASKKSRNGLTTLSRIPKKRSALF